MMDVSSVGSVAADLMDMVTDEYGDDVEVGIVAVVVELNSEDWTAVRYRCNDGRRWIQAGLFEQARRGVHESARQDLDDAEEDD
jgi:hypothetical protein